MNHPLYLSSEGVGFFSPPQLDGSLAVNVACPGALDGLPKFEPEEGGEFLSGAEGTTLRKLSLLTAWPASRRLCLLPLPGFWAVKGCRCWIAGTGPRVTEVGLEEMHPQGQQSPQAEQSRAEQECIAAAPPCWEDGFQQDCFLERDLFGVNKLWAGSGPAWCYLYL